ncbi:MAG: acetyl-CoA carboxylase biotin carboxyl carrier protein subunit [Tannerellaceae bacterium]|jgi:biotin carboxyl carrier protein|nr:acetyl-CoA carboxylase biotin carboxyl carrier protein subunit [Tannerellaceae bacterium]
MKSFKYTINGNVYKVHINSVVENVAEVEVNGTPYNVTMEKPSKKQVVTIKRPVQAPTTPSGEPVVTRPSSASTPGAVRSPLPGIILDVKCSVGSTVKRGDVLFVLEAMKMENNIHADREGSVIELKVNKGDSVLENAELAIIG